MSSQELEPQGVNALWQAPAQALTLARPTPEQIGYGRTGQGNDLTIATLWQVIWEWRWLILSAIAAGFAGAIVTTLLMTPLYRSSAVLEINPPTVQIMGENKGERAETVDNALMETQTGLLKSRALAERVAQDLNLPANETFVGSTEDDRATRERAAVNTLQRNLKVDGELNSRLIDISYSSPDPALAARVVNGFADGFISTGLERKYQSSSYARDFLQRQIANVRRDLENSERQLVAYAQRQGIINTGTNATPGSAPSDANSLTGASLVELNRALADATTRRISAEQAYRQSQSARPSAEAGERTAELRGNRAALQAEYQDKLNVFRADYPDMVRLRSRIESLNQAIAAEESNVRQSRSGTLATDYQAALAAESALRGRVDQLRGQVLNLRGRSIQYNILQRDVDTNRALYDALLQRYKEIGVAGGIGVSNASIVDRGQPAGSAYSPNLILNLLIGLGLGAVVGIATALALEFVNDTIKTPDDVRDRLHLAYLGGIPPLRGVKPAEALRDPTSPISEAFFSTGTSLGFTTDEGAPSSLLITSTRPAEGKSTTTWALSQYYARLGKRVLLIDADLRKPAFVTGHEKDDGLSNLLTTRESLLPHLQQTYIDGLSLLPCGPIPPNPAELLASPRMQAIIDEATANFDMVVVDGPPILGLADSPLLSMYVRGTLMVVEAGKTRSRAAIEALNRMRSAGANMVGCVLMRYRHQSASYGYNYSAYSYKSLENREREIRAIASADS